jgi:hypothetical protein
MDSGKPFDALRLRELYQPDEARLALARQRQSAVWRGDRPDRWPVLFNAPLTAAQGEIPGADHREAFYDPDRMLCSQVRGACSCANARSDGVPSIRANLGTGVLLACLGLEQEVFPDKMPWLKQHLTREQASRLGPEDIRIRGSFERGMGIMRRFREVMGDAPATYCMDTQGPLDLAHLMIGDELFYAVLDDPPFAHHVLRLSVELNIRAHTWMKEAIGEPLTSHHHSNALYAGNMGVRICEDTSAVVGPNVIEEFVVPYTRQVARHFGGAWVHYCGRNDRLTAAVLGIPEVRAINFGHVPGREHDHVFEDEMAKCLRAGKVYFGQWPRREGESGRDYLRRLHGWAARGCLVPAGDAAVRPPDGLGSVAEALEFWYGLA